MQHLEPRTLPQFVRRCDLSAFRKVLGHQHGGGPEEYVRLPIGYHHEGRQQLVYSTSTNKAHA